MKAVPPTKQLNNHEIILALGSEYNWTERSGPDRQPTNFDAAVIAIDHGPLRPAVSVESWKRYFMKNPTHRYHNIL